MAIFYCIRIENPSTLKTRFPYLFPPGTAWPGYTPRHWVRFSSPPTTRRATVEVYEPASTRWSDSSCVRSSLYRLRADPQNTASSIIAYWFTAAEIYLPHSCVATSATRTHTERRLQHLFYCCLTSQRTWRIPLLRVYGPLPRNVWFSNSTVLPLSIYATVSYMH
jgi:hypothetical protein